MKTRSYRTLFSLILILSLVWGIMPGLWTAPVSASPDGRSNGIKFSRPPIRFEINEGQIDQQVRFTARGRDGIAFLTSAEAVLQVTKATGKPDIRPGLKKAAHTSDAQAFENSFVRLKTVGANPDPRITGLERLPGVTNYFIGNDRRKWRTNVAGYVRVKYEDVYPGIDLVYYGNKEGHLEYDFIVAPGADPGRIALSVSGAQEVEIDSSGGLVITAATGTIRQPAPRVYQEIGGRRQEIAGGYRIIKAEESTAGDEPAMPPQVAFALQNYDRKKPLIIDPEILYATYLGGSSTSTIANEGARGVAVDAQGAIYVVGVTISSDFPTLNALQGTLGGFSDAFVTKLDANGQLVYSTYLGGTNGFEGGTVIKVDETGAAYVGGSTSSSDFPTINPIQGRQNRNDAFITKLSPGGNQIVYSTYLGGEDNEGVTDLALDSQRRLYVLGTISPALGTSANDFPTVNPIQATHGGGVSDGFVSIINPAGSDLMFSTYLGGDGEDFFQSIAVNAANDHLFVSFFMDSTNLFPNASPVSPQVNGTRDVNLADILLTLNAAESDFDASLFVLAQQLGGGELSDKTIKLAKFRREESREIFFFITETTAAPPQTNRVQTSEVQPQALGGLDIKLMSLDSNLNVTRTVFFGGSGEDTVSALALDGRGAVYVIGHTRSSDLQTVNPIQPNLTAPNTSDGFLAVFHPQTLQPVFATYLGGTAAESLNAVTVDQQGNIYIVGETFGGFPNPTPGAIQTQLRGRTDAFIVKISPVDIATGPGRDISISPSPLEFGSVIAGQSSDLTLTITNQATSTEALTGNVGTLSAPFSVVSGGGAFNLTPGQSKSVTVRYSPVAAGPVSTNLSITHNATNQTSPANVTLSGTGVAAAPPDLVVSTFEGPGTAITGKRITLSYTIQNQGTAASARFKAGFYLSTDNIITPEDRRLASKSFSRGLPAGGSTGPSSVSITIPRDAAPGPYFIGAIVDPENSVSESDESNNTNFFSITLCNALLKPSLLSPANRATGLSSTPALDWSDVTGASAYEVQVATDSRFTNIVATQTGLTLSEWTVTPALSGSATYYWRARAVSPCGPGPYSANRSFKIGQP